MPVTLYATMIAKPGQRDFIGTALSDLAEQVRAEPGNVRFEVYHIDGKPDEFHVEETYKDEAAFKAHMNSEHGKKFNASIVGKVAGDASTVVFLKSVSTTL